MTVYNLGQLVALAEGAGATEAQAAIMGAIAMAESGGKSDAIGDTTIQTAKWGPSVGLWQIRSLKNPGAYTGVDAMRDKAKLLDPQYNATTAVALYKQKGNFKDWSVFGGAAYGKFLGQAINVQRVENGSDPLATNIGEAVAQVADNPLANVNSLAGYVQSPALWKRIGWGAAGWALLVAGLLVVLLSNKDVQSSAKTAAGAGLSLVPGGGVVAGVSKTAGRAAKTATATHAAAMAAAKGAADGASGAAKTAGVWSC